MADDAKLVSLAKANAVLAEHFSRDSTQIPDPGEVILGGKCFTQGVASPY